MPPQPPTDADRPLSTIFEPIDGPEGVHDPGAEVADDITVPLPDLFGSEPSASDLLGDPAAGDADDSDDPESGDQPSPQRTQSPPTRRTRRASDRIRELVGQRNEARQEADATQQQLELMRQQMAQTQQLIQQMASRPTYYPPAPGQAPNGQSPEQNIQSRQDDFLDNPGQPPAGQPPAPPQYAQNQPQPDFRGLIREALNEQLGPLLEEQSLSAQHQQSFVRAAQDFPELNDQNSAAHQHFMSLYNNSPVRQLPNAPEHIALQVRGLLAEERAETQRAARRKRGAAAVSPQEPVLQDFDEAQVGQARRQYQALLAKMRAGDNSPQTYIAVRQLQRRLAAANTQ